MDENSSGEVTDSPAAPPVNEIQEWLVQMIAAELSLSVDQIPTDQPILSLGVDSMQVVTVVAELEDWLGFQFQSNPLEDHATIEALSQFAANRGSEP